MPLELEDFDAIAARTPIVADLKPGGRYVATDMYEAGGIGLVARELVGAGVTHEGARGVDGRTLGEVGAEVVETPGQDVVVPWETPLKPTGGLAILRGSLAPEGSRRQARGPRATAPQRPGARLRLRGGMLRGGQGPLDPARRRGRHPLRGPGGRPGDARDAARHRGPRRRGPRRRGRAHHRRPLLGRDSRPDGRPHRSRGVPRRPARRGARRRHDHPRRRGPPARPRHPGRGGRGAPRRLDAARAPLHARRVREVRGRSSAPPRRGPSPEATG